MAEDAIVMPAASPEPIDHKRKLEELTDSERVELPTEAKDEADADNGVAESDLSEAKRPRLDDESKLDGLVADENGSKIEGSVEDGKDDEPVVKLEESVEDGKGDEAVKPNEVNEPAENGENTAEEAEAALKTEELEGGEKKKEQTSADNDETEVDGQVKVGDSNAEGAQEHVNAENVQQSNEDVPQENDDGSTITHKIDVPNAKVGVLIGKAGDTIRFLQFNSGAKIQIMRDSDVDRDAPTRPVEIVGTLSSIAKAEKLISAVIAEADAGGSPSLVARGLATTQAVGAVDNVEMQVPNEKVGLIIGRGGETIKGLQTRSGARIQLIPQHLPEGEQSKERTVRVTGDMKQIEIAREMIKDVMNQTVRPSSHSGGYNQQNYRPRGPMGPSPWGQRGHPSQQMPYDYPPQRGAYPSQNSHFQNPNYGGYSQHMAPRNNYGPSWDQRPHSMHGPPSQGGGYDYYGRQSAPMSSSLPGHGPGPASAPMGPPPQSNYNYGQPHGQEYAHPPYSQPAPQPGYAHSYEEHKYDGHAPAPHPYGGPAASQPGYAQQGHQPGYGPQQPYSKPPAYGMPPSQGHQAQNYGPPSQPGDMPYTGHTASAQYNSNAPPQQQYPYASGGSVQPTYPTYGSAPPTDGYSQAPMATAPGSGYPQQAAQPVPTYGQPAAAPQATQPGYTQQGAGAYGQYPSSQQPYSEQPAANNAGYGYQAPQDPNYSAAAGPTYGAPPSGQTGYAQPTTQAGYDQSAPQTGSTYGATVSAAPVTYGKNVSPQPGYAPAPYDATQMYAAR